MTSFAEDLDGLTHATRASKATRSPLINLLDELWANDRDAYAKLIEVLDDDSYHWEDITRVVQAHYGDGVGKRVGMTSIQRWRNQHLERHGHPRTEDE
ncbi:MAG: hypothetical protein AAGA90_19995 [Actinomycetota bacterium]